jgi:hypothetical protein
MHKHTKIEIIKKLENCWELFNGFFLKDKNYTILSIENCAKSYGKSFYIDCTLKYIRYSDLEAIIQ